jgi:hypothetical protein
MPFLTLAQGDPIGLDLFKKLVETRYGGSPPAMEALRITYQGRSQAQLGPIPLWAKVEATATYRFPFQMKWRFDVRVLRFLRSGYTTTFDGEKVYEWEQGKIKPVDDPELVESARRRVWAETVFFVSPLIADDKVRVEGSDNRTFRALAPGYPEIAATVRLNEDNTLNVVEIDRLDPTDRETKCQHLRPVGELKNVDGLIVPEMVQRSWGGPAFMELTPVKVELNPALEPDEFVLHNENLLEGILDNDDDDAPEESA